MRFEMADCVVLRRSAARSKVLSRTIQIRASNCFSVNMNIPGRNKDGRALSLHLKRVTRSYPIREASLPAAFAVIAAYGDQVVMEETLPEALVALFKPSELTALPARRAAAPVSAGELSPELKPRSWLTRQLARFQSPRTYFLTRTS